MVSKVIHKLTQEEHGDVIFHTLTLQDHGENMIHTLTLQDHREKDDSQIDTISSW